MEPALMICLAAVGVCLLALLVPVRIGPVRVCGTLAGLLIVAVAITPVAAEVPPPAVRLAAATAATSRADASAGSVHVVVAGECLWRIARDVLRAGGAEPTSHDIGWFWRRIYDANRDLIGSDPDLILIGQRLSIPEV